MAESIPITIDVNETNRLMGQIKYLNPKYLYMPMHIYMDKDLIKNELPNIQKIAVEDTLYTSLIYNYLVRPYELYRVWDFYHTRYIEESSLSSSGGEYKVINSNFFADSAKQILMNVTLMEK